MADIEKPASGGTNGAAGGEPPVVAVTIPNGTRGRGRPPGSPNRKPETPAGKPPAEDIAYLDPGIIGDLLVNLYEVGDDVFLILILRKAKSKLPPEIFPKFVGEMESIRLGNKDKKMIREAGIALAKKYPFLLVWGPEVILLVCSVQYLARMGAAFRRIDALPDLKAPEKKVAETPEPVKRV